MHSLNTSKIEALYFEFISGIFHHEFGLPVGFFEGFLVVGFAEYDFFVGVAVTGKGDEGFDVGFALGLLVDGVPLGDIVGTLVVGFALDLLVDGVTLGDIVGLLVVGVQS